MSQIMSTRGALILCLLFSILMGYAFHLPEILLLDDDIAGRYKAVVNKDAIDAQLTNFKDWTKGRPLGHASNVTFQSAFLGLPEQVIVFFGIISIGLQALFLRAILCKTGFSAMNANILAMVFFLTPTTPPLFMPVHAFATELSTWFILMSAYAVVSRRYLLAGGLASLQFLVYETYATIFWLPLVFLMLQRLLQSENWDITRADLIITFKASLRFLITFFVFTGIILTVRYLHGTGSSTDIGDLGVFGIISRMFQAGWVGFKVNANLHFDTFMWAMEYGPKYMFLMFISLAAAIFYILPSRVANGVLPKAYSRKTILTIFGMAVIVLFMSYFIYFEQRFPPNSKVGRLANIHSGSRFGVVLVAAAIMLFLQRPRIPKLIGRLVLSLGFTAGLMFHHAYGYQTALSSEKKDSIVEALALACSVSSPDDIIVVVTPRNVSFFTTDKIISWPSSYIGPTSFEGWENKFAIVPYIKSEGFLKAYAEKGEAFTKTDLIPFVDRAFTKYKWTYPWGDIARWPETQGDIRVVMVHDFGENVFLPKLLNEDDAEIGAINSCTRR